MFWSYTSHSHSPLPSLVPPHCCWSFFFQTNSTPTFTVCCCCCLYVHVWSKWVSIGLPTGVCVRSYLHVYRQLISSYTAEENVSFPSIHYLLEILKESRDSWAPLCSWWNGDRLSAGYHNCCESRSAMAMPCLEDSILPHSIPYPRSHILSTLSGCSLSLGRSDADILYRVEHSTVTSS